MTYSNTVLPYKNSEGKATIRPGRGACQTDMNQRLHQYQEPMRRSIFPGRYVCVHVCYGCGPSPSRVRILIAANKASCPSLELYNLSTICFSSVISCKTSQSVCTKSSFLSEIMNFCTVHKLGVSKPSHSAPGPHSDTR